IVTGVIEGQIVRPLPGRSALTMPVAVQGGQGTQRWWFLNGEPLMTQNAADSLSLQLDHPGEYQLVVMDEEGQLVSVTFSRG
ncbi:penicillin-binding protein 1C, partial [Pseudomonas sp. SIMBA_059]